MKKVKLIDLYYTYVLNRLKDDYVYQELQDDAYGNDAIFERPDGRKFVLSIFPSGYDKDGVLIIEFGDEPDSPRGSFCDGELYFVNEMSKEEMCEAIVNEIEGS